VFLLGGKGALDIGGRKFLPGRKRGWGGRVLAVGGESLPPNSGGK